MQTRLLGRTGLKVSAIGCGLIRIGREWGTNLAGESVLTTRAEAKSFLAGAVNLGVTFFDTAPAYGYSEQILGEFLAENRALSSQLVIATKCGEHYNFESN